MANEYVTLTVEKLTGPNVHQDDDTLLLNVNGVTIFRVYGEAGLHTFTNARYGTVGQDESGNLTATIKVTPKELTKINNTSHYRG